MFVQPHPQSAPESVPQFDCTAIRHIHFQSHHLRKPSHTSSSGWDHRHPAVSLSTLPSHGAINSVSHSVCGPHNFPSSLREGSRERMPVSWTLYLLWLSTGVLCKTLTQIKEWFVWEWQNIYIERMSISAFFQAGDICMDIYSKLPENRLIVIYLKWGQMQTLCNQCDTLCIFFSSLPNCVPLLFIERLWQCDLDSVNIILDRTAVGYCWVHDTGWESLL